MELAKKHAERFVKRINLEIERSEYNGEYSVASDPLVFHSTFSKSVLLSLFRHKQEICSCEYFIYSDPKETFEGIVKEVASKRFRFHLKCYAKSFQVIDYFELKDKHVSNIIDVLHFIEERLGVQIGKEYLEKVDQIGYDLFHEFSLIRLKLSDYFDLCKDRLRLVSKAGGIFEDILFRQLLTSSNVLYHYTSFESAVKIIENKSVRLSGIAGMNDSSEVDYFENYVNQLMPLMQVGINHNKKFILSASEVEDDLNMWRLYADDGRGVCIKFVVTSDDPRFRIHKVSYGERQEKFGCLENQHRELNLINKLMENVMDNLQSKLIFSEIDAWKHFFKSFEYSSENEVRLLFYDKDGDLDKKWYINRANILNPAFDVNLIKESPIKLDEIILGPKVPEPSLNKDQLYEFALSKGFKIRISQSKVQNFR